MSGEIGVGAGDGVIKTALLSQIWERCRNKLLRSTATSAGISLLIGAGWIGLRLSNSRLDWADGSSASSLAQLSGAFILVQSFRGDPNRAVPSLWAERLGVQPAKDLWRRYGRSMWWQGWSQDGDAYLILSSSKFPPEGQGLQRQRVGSMEVLASDALHRQQLLQRLKTSHVAKTYVQPDSLWGSCLLALSEAPGVIWNADALARLSGTLAPLLQQGREGCVQLRLHANQLLWEGVIGRRPLNSLTFPTSLFSSGSIKSSITNTTSSDLRLLQIDGYRIDLILGTLLSRQIIQAPLDEHYGINAAMRSTIADLPFSLRLQSRASGAYKAGLQVQLPLAGSRHQWTLILNAVSDRLASRGFQKLQEDRVSPDRETPTLWQRWDDPEPTTVGGWLIIQDQSAPVLSIGFGTEPAAQIFLSTLFPQNRISLKVSGEPKRLSQLGLLGGAWPKSVQRASNLNLEIKPLKISDGSKLARMSWWRVNGSLTLTPDS